MAKDAREYKEISAHLRTGLETELEEENYMTFKGDFVPYTTLVTSVTGRR